MDNWYYAKNNQKHGPVTLAALEVLVASGFLAPADMLLQDGMSKWVRADSVKGRAQLNVEVEHVNLPAATLLDVTLHHGTATVALGQIKLSALGSGELEPIPRMAPLFPPFRRATS